MQKLKNFNWKNFFLQGVLPFALAITAAFIARYQLELSDGVTPDFLAMQWPLYAPLNALTAFCLTLVLFAILGKWSRATGISGALFTVIALINYYTRDLHGSALMPQDILNLGTAAEVMGSYTLQITATVRTIIVVSAGAGDCFCAGAAGQGLPQARQLARPRCTGTGLCRQCVLRTLFRLLWAGFGQAQNHLRLGLAEYLL